MELPQTLRLLSVPVWLRATVALLLLAGCGGALYLAVRGLGEPDGHSLDVGVQLLGILLPLVIGGLLLSFSRRGVPALRERTDHLLFELLPAALQRISTSGNQAEYPSARSAQPLFRAKLRRPREGEAADVIVTGLEGLCEAQYKVTLPRPVWSGLPSGDMALSISFGVNVNRINFCLLVERDTLRRVANGGRPLARDPDQESKVAADLLGKRFHHTVEGAEHKVVTGYVFSKSLLEGPVDGRPTWWWAAYRTLPDDFLWDPAQQLFIMQDLVIMLQSFLMEWPELFEVSPAQARPA